MVFKRQCGSHSFYLRAVRQQSSYMYHSTHTKTEQSKWSWYYTHTHTPVRLSLFPDSVLTELVLLSMKQTLDQGKEVQLKHQCRVTFITLKPEFEFFLFNKWTVCVLSFSVGSEKSLKVSDKSNICSNTFAVNKHTYLNIPKKHNYK